MKIFIVVAAFVTGIVLTVCVYQAITIYQLRTQVANNTTSILQIIDFINKNTQTQPTLNNQ